MPSTPLVLALDIGTSSTRALLFDASGRKVGLAVQKPYENTTTPDGGVEVDAERLMGLTIECIDELLNSEETPREAIAAIACSCFWHSILAVDEAGIHLTPVFSWADNRAAPWVSPLRATLDEAHTHARTGCVFHPSYWPAKLLWLQATRPELFQSPRPRWMSFGEFVGLRLTGNARVSLSMASGTGLFHQNECGWDREVLSAAPLAEQQLSPLCDAGDSLGALLPEWREKWPLLKGALVFPALGDGACSNVGSGGVDASTIVMNCGTSGALRIVLEGWTSPAPRGLWRYRVDKRRSVMGGALSNAGNVLLWALDTLRLPPDWNAQLEAERGEHGLTVLPFLAGERSPLWNARARFVVEGATLDTEPVQILRASLEGASLRFKAVADALRLSMRESGLDPGVPIAFSGGALDASPAWAQMMCDCLSAPLVESREKEGSARGAALLALESLGAIASIADLPGERGRELQPDLSRREGYTRALEKQNALYEHLYEPLRAV